MAFFTFERNFVKNLDCRLELLTYLLEQNREKIKDGKHSEMSENFFKIYLYLLNED